MVVTVPVTIRNQIVAGEWIPFTYNLGYNLYVGNHADATGGFAQITGTQQISSRWETGLDGGLALAGLWFLRPYGARGRFLMGYVAAITLGVVPFFVTDRYRHHSSREPPSSVPWLSLGLTKLSRVLPERLN